MAKTAVYVCDCAGLVSDHVDTSSLEQLANTLDDVALVRRVEQLCHKAGLEALGQDLRQAGVERLLFAGCSPRMSLKLPEEVLAAVAHEAGLDPCRVEVANIREQGAWVHRGDHEVASAAARDELRMAHARLAGGDPSAEPVPLSRRVLVVGGGPAGLAAARDLALAGTDAVLVERLPYLGGKLCQVPHMFQTAAWPSTCHNSCIGPVHAREALHNPRVALHMSAEVTALRKHRGNFHATVRCAPRWVDPDRCISCGQCEQACPEQAPDPFELGHATRKAIAKPFPRAVPDSVSILEQACTFCGDCTEVCPTGAIDLQAQPTVVQETVGAVVLATGTEQRDPAQSPELGADASNVITSLELERLMANGLRRPSDGAEPESLLFVQCAGSRAGMDKQGAGVPYCSRTCCAVTAKQATRVAATSPMTEVNVLYYRDFRSYERALEKLHQDASAMGIEFHNGEITAIEQGDDGALAVQYNRLGTEALEHQGASDTLEADLVVLACAQEPRPPSWTQDLGLPLDTFGFPIEGQPRVLRPTETFVDRVYTVGAAVGPKSIQPAIEQGTAAAMKAMQALGAGSRQPLKHVSSVNPERCGRCGVCASVCPHGAVQVTDDGACVDPAFCQTCGMCAASCPSHAAMLRNFSDELLLRQARLAFTEAPAGEPRILALLCYWCAYGGADLAGVNGLELPSCLRTMRVRCSSSVNLGLVTELFRMGLDGVIVCGCPDNSCHHMWGNWLAQKRTALMQSLMRQMGLDERRLKFEVIGIMHSDKLLQVTEKLRHDLRALGPNPWGAAGGEQGARS